MSGSLYSVPADSEVALLARPVSAVLVRVVLPDGGSPDEAVVRCASTRDGSTHTRYFTWSPQQPDLRLAQGKAEVTAWISKTGEPRVRDEERAHLISESVEVRVEPGATPAEIELVLGGSRGIRGRVVYEGPRLTGGWPQVKLIALAPGAEVSAEDFEEASRGEYLRGDRDFAFVDLDPGTYAVGFMRLNSGAAEVHEVLEVGEGLSECVLTVPPLDESRTLAIRVTDPDGEPVSDVRFGFRHTNKGGGSSSNSGFSGLRDGEGRYHIAIPANARRSYFGGENDGASFAITASNEEFGTRTADLSAGQTEVEITFTEPAELVVHVVGYSGSTLAGRLSINARPAGNTAGHSFSFNNVSVSSRGVKRFEKLATGPHLITMRLKPTDNSPYGGSEIAKVEIELSTGENTLNFPVPPLHPLDVTVPGAEEDQDVRLQRRGELEDSWRFSSSLRCDASGRVLFGELPAGPYRITARVDGRPRTLEVEIPCGPVNLGPGEED
ncbi:MAG: hypothetical protein CMJ84_02940 [Planctomycetes bacterium]|jgi:hypothetical protein|nr:hypothetical protein [Planctomycetota bacterium]MDP6408042.1 hypothetical protein [Planctomycetota bacterium]